MVKNYKNLVLGFWIIVVPFLGLPLSWKFAVIVLSGLLLVFMSIEIDLPKRVSVKKVRKTKVLKNDTESSISDVSNKTSDFVLEKSVEVENSDESQIAN